jgi:hypothetical protein
MPHFDSDISTRIKRAGRACCFDSSPGRLPINLLPISSDWPSANWRHQGLKHPERSQCGSADLTVREKDRQCDFFAAGDRINRYVAFNGLCERTAGLNVM